MKIGIDAKALRTSFPHGVKSYAQNLLVNLAKIDKKNEYIIFSSKKIRIPKQRNFRLIVFPNALPILKRQLLTPFYVMKERIDIFHNLEPFGSVFLNHSKVVTTVHDINLSGTFPLFSKYFLERIYCEFTRSLVLQKSLAIITDSEAIQKELSERQNVAKRTVVRVIYLGYNKEFFTFENYKKRSGILYMGDLFGRKNILREIKAYSDLPLGLKRVHKLKIISSTKFAADNFKKLIRKFGIEKFAEIYVGIRTEQLAELYNRTALFVYASLYEGFGIPILEAMACGCPVVTSNYGAMKEIAGDAALFANPRSEKSISESIYKMCNDYSLRRTLVKKGLRRVKRFNWMDTAKKTLELYRDVYRMQ
jgi:glycosyltransferase involved in cell wall biosynthesis